MLIGKGTNGLSGISSLLEDDIVAYALLRVVLIMSLPVPPIAELDISYFTYHTRSYHSSLALTIIIIIIIITIIIIVIIIIIINYALTEG